MGDLALVLRTETVPIGSVSPHPKNARKGNAQRIEQSLRSHGQYKPIIVHEESGHILVGNNTWRIAKDKVGWDKIQATFVSCSDKQALEILAVDNRTSDGASYDNEALLELLDGITDAGGTLLSAGFTSEDRDDLAALLEEVPAPTMPIPATRFSDDGSQGSGARMMSEGYADRTARNIIVTLEGEKYIEFTEALDRLGKEFGTDSYSETIVAAVYHMDGGDDE